MKAYSLSSGAGLAGLQAGELRSRPLGDNDVRVAVRAASLNYRDLMYARGIYFNPPAHALVPLGDGVGEVVEIGASVTRFATGDRVITTYWPKWIDGTGSPEKTRDSYGTQINGMLAEELVAHEEGLVRAPTGLSDAAAATITCAGVTAWNALFVRGEAKPGSTVLILGTGGVAVWALQLAVAVGLNPIVTSSSDDKLARAEGLGARALINYKKTPEWQDEVLRITRGCGVDLALEVGGEDTLPRSLAATGFGGTVIVIGGLSGFGDAAISPLSLIGGMKRLAGVSVGSRKSTEDLVRFVELKEMEPVIDHEFAFSDALAAYQHLEAGRAFGKIVVNVR